MKGTVLEPGDARSQVQAENYHRDGFLIVRGVFSSHDVAGLHTDARRLLQLTEQIDLSRGVVLTLEPGDVALFSGFTPHRSAANRSGESRRLLYLSYNADSDGGDQREAHYREFHAWLKDRYAEYGKTNTFFR